MYKYIFAIFLCPLIGNAQNISIHFESKETWQNIFVKARNEHKYIFLDCYASWCEPCKKMEQEVYSKDSVAQYVNSKFIALKLQLDSTKKDDIDLVNRYAEAHSVLVKYNVNSFPTFLIFSEDGTIVDRGQGYMNTEEFIRFLINSQDPKKEFYTLLNSYQKGIKDYPNILYLAKRAQEFNQNSLADSLANDYINNYWLRLDNSLLYSKNMIAFASSFTDLMSTNSSIMDVLIGHEDKVDSAMKDSGYASRCINYMIYKDYVKPKLITADSLKEDPNWKEIAYTIREKFGKSYSEQNVLGGEISWYRNKTNWSNYTKYLVQKISKFGIGFNHGILLGVYLNNYAFDVFKYSADRRELESALTWSDKAIKLDENHPSATLLDTKANILYKLGRRKDGIALEEYAAEISPQNKEIQTALEKMKMGLSTWIIPTTK